MELEQKLTNGSLEAPNLVEERMHDRHQVTEDFDLPKEFVQ
jgi:hypothetical protein